VDWLHWIGKQYYTTNSFIKEAEKYGVSRRVSLQQLKQMSWGDTIYCAMLDGKTGVIFGYFKVKQITGLDPETAERVRDRYACELLDNGGYAVSRSCGEYATGATYSISADIKEIANEIMNIEGEKENLRPPPTPPRGGKSKLMVSGHFTIKEPIRLLDIPFRQGFRAINGKSLIYQAENNNRKVKGQFYLEAATKLWYEHNRIPQSGDIQEVKTYNKNLNTRKKGQQKARMPKQLTFNY